MNLIYKTLNVPVEEGMFRFEVDEDLFKQLDLVRENLNKPTDLNYPQLIIDNHEKHVKTEESRPDFAFNLAFLQKIVSSTKKTSANSSLAS